MFPKNARFLLVDDSSSIRALIKQQLTKLGYSNIEDANNGIEALNELDRLKKAGAPVHLIIADLKMPEMDGISFLKKLKEHPEYKLIPFIMIAAETESEKIVETMALGANDFAVKPFDENELLRKLKAIWLRMEQDKKHKKK